MEGVQGSTGAYGGGARGRRFVVPCPACAEEGGWTAAAEREDPCLLCGGFGRVPRTVAEYYLLAEHGPVAA